MSKIKYGQIGVGHAHANKISVYRNSPDYEVVGVAEPDAELRKKAEASDTYRDLKWLTEEQLLNIEGLKVVGVETRVRNLLSTAERCIAADKHIHLDNSRESDIRVLSGIHHHHDKDVHDRVYDDHILLADTIHKEKREHHRNKVRDDRDDHNRTVIHFSGRLERERGFPSDAVHLYRKLHTDHIHILPGSSRYGR